MNTYACFDIGGTNLKMGIVDSEGNIISFDSIKTPASYEETIRNISEYINGKKAQAAGICVPGTCSADGKVIFSPNLTTINEKNLINDIKPLTNIEICLENDANLAALGEYTFYENSNIKNMALITLGTGVGGGLILNGMLHGTEVSSFEAGHLTINSHGEKCKCGKRGCFEIYCSVSGILSTYKELSEGERLEHVGELMRIHNKNNKLTSLTFDIYANHLAHGLATIANLVTPEKIKVGGGLSEISENFLPQTIKIFSRIIYPAYKSRVLIETAKGKNKAGILGAAAYCIQKGY